MNSQEELAWLAGIVEGEGCIALDEEKYPSLTIVMSDRDVVERCATILKHNITKQAASVGHFGYKDLHRLKLSGQKAANWIADLYQYFGERRKTKSMEVLTAWAISKPYDDDYLCINGHFMENQDVTNIDGTRRPCNKCHRKAANKYYRRKKYRNKLANGKR